MLVVRQYRLEKSVVLPGDSQEVRSDTRIEVHDISLILANKLQTVDALLQTLAESPAVHNNEYKRADIVINGRQHSSSDLTDFYMWLDKNGKINWISNINDTTYQKYKGTDLSYRPYFSIPKATHTVYYSSLIESNDKIPRLYISYPVINTTGQGQGQVREWNCYWCSGYLNQTPNLGQLFEKSIISTI